MQEQVQKNELIKQKLFEYEAHIDEYRASLNTEGVWLFLATLGCWSVEQPLYQAYALLITIVLFTHRIYSKLSDKRSFSTISKDLENIITTELKEGDTRKARLHDLHQIHKIKLATKSHLKSTVIFLLCYSFVGLTLFNLYQTINQ